MPLTPLQALNRVFEDRLAVAKLTGFRTIANLLAQDRVKVCRKTTIDWDVDVGGETAAYEAVTANGATTGDGDTVPAQLNIGQFRLKYQQPISKIAIQEAAQVAPEDLADLFGAYTDRAITQIMRKLNQSLFTGDGTATHGGIVGLTTAGAATGTYAGINQATRPTWAGIVAANGGTARPLTRSLLLDLEKLVADNESMYDMAICGTDIDRSYQSVFDTLAGVNQLNQATGNKVLPTIDLGHSDRSYNGYPLVADYMAPNGTLWLLNTSDVDICAFELPAVEGDGVGAHVVNNGMGIPVHIHEIASMNSSVRIFEWVIYPQVRVRNRKSIIRLADLT